MNDISLDRLIQTEVDRRLALALNGAMDESGVTITLQEAVKRAFIKMNIDEMVERAMKDSIHRMVSDKLSRMQSYVGTDQIQRAVEKHVTSEVMPKLIKLLKVGE